MAFFVIEHVDPELFEWSICEYRHIIEFLAGTNLSLQVYNLKESITLGQEKLVGAEVFAHSFGESGVDLSKVALLDMRAETGLQQSDLQTYTHYLFGGILGDHPPQDRTKHLRDVGYELRHVGPTQMPTDHAALCTKLILSDGKLLEDIPYVEGPEFQTPYGDYIEMQGFRYMVDEEGKPIIAKDLFPLMCKDFTEF